jgi:lipoprotein Spr
MNKKKLIRTIAYNIFIISLLINLTSCGSLRRHAQKVEREEKKISLYKEYSQKLGFQLDGTENESLMRISTEWLGVPYQYGGCSKQGTDCSCLIATIYQQVYGITLERSSEDIKKKNCKIIDKEELKEGDLVFFSIKSKKISHVGLYLKDGNFIHSTTSKGVMINNLNEAYYTKYYTCSGRVLK